MPTTRMSSVTGNGQKHPHDAIGDALLGLAAYWLPFAPLDLPPQPDASLYLDLDCAVGAAEQRGPSPLDAAVRITPARDACSSGRRYRAGGRARPSRGS